MGAWPPGVARVDLGTVDGTSAEAARRAPDGPTWITAEMQTGARGRRGRAWRMAPGDFAASLAWRPPGGPADWALRSFVASLALHDALTGVGAEGLALKWPNDVLLRGGKLAGILLEVPRPGLLVLGVGVNLARAPMPAEVEPGATRPVSLAMPHVTPGTLMEALAPAFAAREAVLVERGFAPVRADWLARAARLGEEVTARLPGGAVTGRFETLDDDGRLVLATDAGRRTISAGDVFFGAGAYEAPAEAAPCS
jgi:BirA family biotin operon repressor/biotin-[acetyl-CoA-carboxylase] ligase